MCLRCQTALSHSACGDVLVAGQAPPVRLHELAAERIGEGLLGGAGRSAFTRMGVVVMALHLSVNAGPGEQPWDGPPYRNNREEGNGCVALTRGHVDQLGHLLLGDGDLLGLALLAVELEDDRAVPSGSISGLPSATGVSRPVFLPSTQIWAPAGLVLQASLPLAAGPGAGSACTVGFGAGLGSALARSGGGRAAAPPSRARRRPAPRGSPSERNLPE